MRRPARLLKQIALAAITGTIVGVLMTAASVYYAVHRSASATANSQMLILKGDKGENGITTVSRSDYATSVQIQLFEPGVLNASFTSIRFEPTPREYRGLGGDTYESPTLDIGWSRGLSNPMDTEEPRWKETVYGWPMRCFRVRGEASCVGPMTPISYRWAGVPGFSIVWGETTRSTAAFGVPTFALVLLVMLAAGPMRRARRRRRGRCPACNYDLHGQPTPGCPECGTGRAAPQDAATSPPSPSSPPPSSAHAPTWAAS